MKQYKTTIISLVVIVVMLVGFFVTWSLIDKDKTDAQTATPTESIATESVFDFSSISKINLYECNIVDNIKLQRDSSGNWLSTTHADVDLYAVGINSALNSVKSCSATSVYE